MSVSAFIHLSLLCPKFHPRSVSLRLLNYIVHSLRTRFLIVCERALCLPHTSATRGSGNYRDDKRRGEKPSASRVRRQTRLKQSHERRQSCDCDASREEWRAVPSVLRQGSLV